MPAVRVLWVTKGLGPGGTERLLVELAGAIDPAVIEVRAAYVLPWKDHLAGDLEAAGVRTTCLSRRRRDPLWPWRLRRLVADADVVHAHAPVPAVAARLAVWTLRRRHRPPVVMTEHNTWTSYRWSTRWANRLTGAGDAITLAVSREAQASLRGAAARRAEVLVHGVDVEAIRSGDRAAARQRIRAELDLSADEVVIGTVANLRAQKDYPNLLAAARLLVDEGVSFKVVAVGQGPLEGEIRARRDALGLTDEVVLMGYRADAVDVLSACDAFVLASAWEGLPVAVMEATALGLPIVATRVGGVAEHLNHETAVLVPPGDARALATGLAEVIRDGARRRALAARSRAAADRFDIGQAAAVHMEHYRVLVPPVPGSCAAPTGAPAVTSATPSRRRPQIRPLEPSDRDALVDLFTVALNWEDDPPHRRLLAWKHDTNPFGPSPGWVVDDGGEIVAARVMMRWDFRRGGRVVRAVRAVDTATHPAWQGAGLFTALTRHAVESCRAEGIAFVFNTPNDKSRPGYLKLGWRDVGRLPVAVRPRALRDLPDVARGRQPATRWSEPIDVGTDIASWLDGGGWRWPAPGTADEVGASADRTLRTAVDDRFLRWRYGLPDLGYRVVDDGDAAVVVRLRRRGAGRELVVAQRFGDLRRADRLAVDLLGAVDASHALRLGAADLRHGFVAVPNGGPRLTWRALADPGPPPLPNWNFELGDIELF